jgi:hypothetical protein
MDIYADTYNGGTQAVSDAIDRSIDRSETVTIRTSRHADDVRDELFEMCDGDGEDEYWGTLDISDEFGDIKGHWRVVVIAD